MDGATSSRCAPPEHGNHIAQQREQTPTAREDSVRLGQFCLIISFHARSMSLASLEMPRHLNDSYNCVAFSHFPYFAASWSLRDILDEKLPSPSSLGVASVCGCIQSPSHTLHYGAILFRFFFFADPPLLGFCSKEIQTSSPSDSLPNPNDQFRAVAGRCS